MNYAYENIKFESICVSHYFDESRNATFCAQILMTFASIHLKF